MSATSGQNKAVVWQRGIAAQVTVKLIEMQAQRKGLSAIVIRVIYALIPNW